MARGIIQEIEFLVDQAAAAKLERDAGKLGERAGNSLGERMMRSMKNGMGQFTLGLVGADLLGGAIRQVGLAVRQFGIDMYSMATSAEETRSKFRTTFGEATEDVESFINSFGQMAGIAKVQAMDTASTIGAIAQGMGMTEKAAGTFSTTVLKAAGDVQSFFNIPIAQVLADMQSGFAGQVEPMRKYGVELTAAAVKTEGLRLAGKKSGDELTRMEKTAGALSLMTKQLGKANGDLERTQSSVTNRGRALGAMWQNTKQDIADQLLPAFATMTDTLYKNRDAIATVAKALGSGLVIAVNLVMNTLTFFWKAGESIFASMNQAVDEITASAYRWAAALARAAEFMAIGPWNKTFRENMRAANELMLANADAADASAKANKAAADEAARQARIAAMADPSVVKGPKDAGGGGKTKRGTTTTPVDQNTLDEAAKKAEEERKKRIGVLTQGAKMERTRAESLVQLEKEEARLTERLKEGNLSLEKRIALEEELENIRQTIRDASPAELEIDALKKKADAHRNEYDTLNRLVAIRDALMRKVLEQSAAGAKVSEEEKQRTAESLEEVNQIIAGMDGPAIFAKHTIDAMKKAVSVTDLLKVGLQDAGQAMLKLGSGSAKAYLKELAKMAEGEYKVATANVIKYTGLGLYKLAMRDTKGAGLSFAAAGKAAIEAVKWRAVMAVGAAAGGGDGGGGGGGDGGGGSGGRNTAGDTAAQSQPRGPNITVYIDTNDPDNPVHQAFIYDSYNNAVERIGENGRGTIRVRPRNSAPTT